MIPPASLRWPSVAYNECVPVQHGFYSFGENIVSIVEPGGSLGKDGNVLFTKLPTVLGLLHCFLQLTVGQILAINEPRTERVPQKYH